MVRCQEHSEPALEFAWNLLAYSAVPRANHTIRTLPPSLSSAYARAHDDALWDALLATLGAAEHRDDQRAKLLASLPGRLGGLGLRSAQCCAKAAYWASWVDALPVLASKAPWLTTKILQDLHRVGGPGAECLREAAEARAHLADMGANDLPSWAEAAAGSEPPQPATEDDILTARGWQHHTCSISETFLQERVLLPQCDPCQKAMVLSQGGAGGAWLRAIPSEHVFRMQVLRFQVAMRRRLRWPLPLTNHRCRGNHCRCLHDNLGDHPASCALSGLLKRRSRPIERVWARILREAGARVRENVSLHDAGVAVDAGDGRNIEIVATGLPICHGIPAAVDATLVSPLSADGTPHAHADCRIGVSLARARRTKDTTYPELLSSSRLRLVVVAVEVGGRISTETAQLLTDLSSFKARSEPEVLKGSIATMWRSRWSTMLSVVCQDTFAATLVDDGVDFLDAVGTGSPLSVDVWLDES
jgi:hypothetical protein